MSEFGGLWKHANNPACTESVKVFVILKLDNIRKKKKEEEEERKKERLRNFEVGQYTKEEEEEEEEQEEQEQEERKKERKNTNHSQP